MAGGFSNGFSDGFGPTLYPRVVTRRERLFEKLNKEKKMESLILRGASASGLYVGRPGIYMNVQNLQFDIPASGSATAYSVTLSGATTGAYTFNDSLNLTLRFKPNEDVYITTTNFVSNYGLVINYTQGGDMSSYMQTDPTRSGEIPYGIPNFWRFR